MGEATETETREKTEHFVPSYIAKSVAIAVTCEWNTDTHALAPTYTLHGWLAQLGPPDPEPNWPLKTS